MIINLFHTLLHTLKRFFQKETVLTISFILAALSACFVLPSPDYIGYIDFRVLALLFCLMTVVAGFRKLGVFDRLGSKLTSGVKTLRSLCAVLIYLCFFTSMLITNDVALITFVPFAIYLLKRTGQQKSIIRVVILQTVAANLGSMLTPIGNPQNLYLYSLIGCSAAEFVRIMLPLTAVSFVLLALALFLIPKTSLRENTSADSSGCPAAGFTADRFAAINYFLLFILALGTVIRLLPWPVLLLIVAADILITDRDLFSKVDYSLLATFVCFFVFIGNMQKIPAVKTFLEQALTGRELFMGAAASQIISNVPAAMLLSGFTGAYRELLYGVNIGGLGTLIASLASLISYRAYVKSGEGRKGSYLLQFTVWNVVFLAVLGVVAAGVVNSN